MEKASKEALFPRGALLFGLPWNREGPESSGVWLVRELGSLLESEEKLRVVEISAEQADAGQVREEVWRWVRTGLARTGRGYDSLFWWSFAANPSLRAFFTALIAYLGAGQYDAHRYTLVECAHIIGTLVNAGRYLLVLDGMEQMVYPDGDNYGLLRDEALRTCLEFLAGAPSSLSIAICEHQMFDLIAYTTASQIRYRPDGETVLR